MNEKAQKWECSFASEFGHHSTIGVWRWRRLRWVPICSTCRLTFPPAEETR